jgi:hypothetical protein
MRRTCKARELKSKPPNWREIQKVRGRDGTQEL